MVSVLMTLAFLAGAGLVAYGAWLIFRPAGFIAAGALLATVAVLHERGAR